MSSSSHFDGTATLGWSLLKADIESTAFVKGWNSEQKLQTLVSRITGKAFKFYKNRSNTVQTDYETLCELFNDRFDKVGYPLLILKHLENIFPYPDELLDEFTDRIEEPGSNGKNQGREEFVDLDENVDTVQVHNDEPELYTPSKHLSEVECNGPMENDGADTNLMIEKTEDHSPVMLGQRKEQTPHKGETIEKVSNPAKEYHTTPYHSKDVMADAVYTMESPSPKYEPDWLGEDDEKIQSEESPSHNYKPDAICDADEKEQTLPTTPQCLNKPKINGGLKINERKVKVKEQTESPRLITRQKLHFMVQSIVDENNKLNRKILSNRRERIPEEDNNLSAEACIQKYDEAKQTQTKYEPGENKDTKIEEERTLSSKYEIKRASCQSRLNHHELKMLSDIIDRLAPTYVYRSDKWLTCELKNRKYRYWTTPPMIDERDTGETDSERKRQIAVQGSQQYFHGTMCYHPKEQTSKTEHFTQTDKELFRIDVSHERKETTSQSTQTTDDLQMVNGKDKKWTYDFTHTEIEQQTINAKCEHQMDIHVGEKKKGNTREEIKHNNLTNGKRETETEKKLYKVTRSSKTKTKKSNVVQKIKLEKRKLIYLRGNKETHSRKTIPTTSRTLIRRKERLDTPAIQKTMSRFRKGLQKPTTKQMNKRKHCTTVGKLVRNTNTYSTDINHECLVTDTQFSGSTAFEKDKWSLFAT
ncbi:Hypothetical predicted protein [Mytilus galloprovincialis]|uniref:Uncharacterized protein n=1 Tax=Mytilus galloprovincialis TaxID=29158 RepID=A0A8B6GM10_MYTGA|nr:Hypothetical predicted protein [Mytilus galloprovincialis]